AACPLLLGKLTIPDKVKADYVRTAQKLGFNVNELLWVKQ
ncbi:hypothetical protein HMPREF1592_02323, partial [Escherichia coli 907357]